MSMLGVTWYRDMRYLASSTALSKPRSSFCSGWGDAGVKRALGRGQDTTHERACTMPYIMSSWLMAVRMDRLGLSLRTEEDVAKLVFKTLG